MKRILSVLVLSLFAAPLLTAQTAQTSAATPPPPIAVAPPSGPPQPVYFYLYARITDHVNLDVTEDRLHRLLPMIEKLRTAHPEARVTAVVLFSGASSEALAKRNAVTGIKDFVLGYKKRGIIEVGYDGTDEPTYQHRPMFPMIEEKSTQERWLARASEDEKFLTEGRNPLTGDPMPGTVGGLKEMQAVFGEAAYITGVSVGELQPEAGFRPDMPGAGAVPNVKPEVGDWEIVPLLRRYNTQAILFGLPGSNPAHLPGFGGAIAEIGKLMSPVPQASPELFWGNNILRSSEAGGRDARVVHGYDGPDGIKAFASKLNRSDIRIIHMELGSETDYLKPDFAKTPLSPSLIYAYAHPDNPKLPAEARLSADEVNAAYAKEQSTLNWLVAEYFPANSGSRFVSNSDLKRMTPPSTGYSIPVDAIRASLKQAVEMWGINTYPPSYFQVGDHYLSLADTFQLLTDALAELNRTGKLPESVTVAKVYGPIGMNVGHGPNVGEVKVASIAKICAGIEASLHDDTGYPMPNNRVPTFLTVDGIGINSAQFLRLMAQALVDAKPDTSIRVRMTYMSPATAEVFPKTRPRDDVGETWTFKPAPLEASGPSQAMR